MTLQDLGSIGEFVAALATIATLIYLAVQIRQNTKQARLASVRDLTGGVNELNASLYGDPELSELVLRGEDDFEALTPLERKRFDMFEFSRLNIAEYVQDLESEGISDLNFRYVEWIVREFQTKPGLRAFIREYKDLYVGSDELLTRLLGP